MGVNSEKIPDEEFRRRVTFSVEELRRRFPWAPWDGGYRWFETSNVIDLWPYYTEAQRFEIYRRLRRVSR